MSLLRTLFGLALAAWMALAGAEEFAAIPALSAHVTDSAGMLDAGQRAKLEALLKDYETRTGGQIGILLIASTAPEAIEQYSIRVAEAWKLGRKGVDDGVILVVAKDNPKALRRLRIEAGRGIQGTVTDAQSKRILEDVIAPRFRQNDYYGGLTAAVGALTALMDQEHLPAPAKPAAQQPGDDGEFARIPFFVVFFIIAIIAWRVRYVRPGLDRGGWGRSAGVMLGSGIGSSGFGSHRSSGGSSGDSGFSGGGGSFDGGGASGDW